MFYVGNNMSDEQKTSIDSKDVEKLGTATDSPLLLEIKAQVEKLAGKVEDLSNRMNKAKPADEEEEEKPEEETKAAKKPGYPAGDVKAKPDEEKGKKPMEVGPSTEEEEKAGAPMVVAPSRQEGYTEPTGRNIGDVSPGEDRKAAKPKEEEKAKKPSEYPYPEEKAQIDKIMEEMDSLRGEMGSISKALGRPMKRTEILKAGTNDEVVDIGKLPWIEIHRLGRMSGI